MFTHSSALRRGLLLAAVLLITVLVAPVLTAGAAGQDNNVYWNELGHNSRDPLYRNPGGAVPTGTAVTLRLRAAENDLTGATVRVWDDRNDQQSLLPMTRVASGVTFPNDGNVYEFWEVTLPAPPDPTVFWYRFIAVDGSSTAYYEDDAARTGGWGQTIGSTEDRSWQLTYYDPAFETPDWVKNAVIYQIFADRFRDGDSSNNPAAGEFFYGEFDTIVRSNQTDWNARICDPRSDAGSAAVCADKYSQNFYGGDLQGIIDQLDYIEDLGVTAIYLNPIFESPSNHKYDTKDFLQIDDNFGDLALFQTLVGEAHSRGINIILDGVFNHSSSDSIYFDRYSRWDAAGNPTTIGDNDGSGACESLASPLVDWYPFIPYAGTGTAPCSDNRDYNYWFGIFDSLPVYDHDYPAVRDFFIEDGTNAVGPYWMQWADGWRLDVAPEVDPGQTNDPNDDYWERFRLAVHAVNPDAYIVGEEWGNPTSWTIGGEWDATMNYQFAAAVLSFWRDTTFYDNDFNTGSSAGELNPLDAGGVAERLLNLQERYAPEAFAAMMNLFNSHDTNRVLLLLDQNANSRSTADYNNPAYDWSDSITRYKGALILQMTLPGAPTIYYGDEVGTVNPPAAGPQWQDDPYNRVPYPWLDQSGTPYYTHMQSATSQAALRDYVAQLTGIRNANEALRTGTFDVLDSGNSSVFAYGRSLGGDLFIVLANKSGAAQNVTVNLAGYAPAGATLDDLLNGGTESINGSGELNITVPARSGNILRVQGAVSAPGTVTDLNATGLANQVDLSWSAASGADSYDIYRSQLSGGGYVNIGNTTSTSYSDNTVSNGVEYFYVVVARDDTTLITGEMSNEASAIPAYSIGWANLQDPPTLNHTVSATLLTDTVYGQIWIDGVTNQPGATPGLLAELGYGDSTDVNDGSWQWFAMSFNVDAGNNDEYQGNLPRNEIGTFCYTTRYSTTGGASWFYALNGPDEGNTTCPGPFGVLTVTTGGDTTAPAAPTNLAVTGVTSASITLGWDAHPNTDGDLFGFRIYRGPVGGPYAQIDQVDDAAAVSYTDTTVSNGATYEYYITALDDSVNESDDSNIVEATAENLLVDVTFRVTVPDFTGDTYPVHIVGPFNGWTPGDPAYALTEVSPNVWEITLQILDGTNFIHKFARGGWERVEKQADGYAEVPDRSVTIDYGTTGEQLIEVTIANWRDRFVVDHTPADSETGVSPNAVITAAWNKWTCTPPNGTFSVTGPSGAVSGTFSWDDSTWTHTFTPDNPLEPGNHDVAISGNDCNGDNQYVDKAFSFTVGTAAPAMVDVTFSVTVPDHTPGTVYLVGNFDSFAGSPYPAWDPAGLAMTEVSPQVWEITLQLPDGDNFEYKYTRGSWETVEKEADGNSDILGGGNRGITVDEGTTGEQTVSDTVANWRDPYVTAHSPADGAGGVSPSATIEITWNQAMPAVPGGTFSVTGPGGPVTGSLAYNAGTFTHTFTPGAPLETGQHTVEVSGNSDVAGDTQQVATSFSFSVPEPPPPPQDIYVSADKPGTTSDGVDYLPGDILLFDGAGWSLFFDGQAANLKTRADLEAIDVADGGDTYMSFSKRGFVHGIVPRVSPSDILHWDGSRFTFFLEGSDIGLTTGGEAIDGLAVLDGSVSPIGSNCEAYVLVSLKSGGKVPGIPGRVRGEDVIGLCATNTGVLGSGQWHMVVDGSAAGMPRNAVYSLSASADGTLLYFTTKKQFNVPPATGSHSLVYTYDTTTGDFGAAVFDANAVGLNGTVDGLDYNPPSGP